MKERVSAFLNRVENARASQAIRSGLVTVIPVLLIGSAALILRSLPVSAYQSFIASFLDGFLLDVFNLVYSATFEMLSCFVTITVSYSYAREWGGGSPRGAVITSMAVFFVLVGVHSGEVSWGALGVKGMFTAILSATVTPYVFIRLSNAVKNRAKPYSEGADGGFTKSMAAFIPAALVITGFAVINASISELFGVGSLHELFITAANAIFEPMGRSVLSGALFVLLSSLLWFFGIHGSDVLEAVMEKVFTPAAGINEALRSAGMAPTEILTKEFFDVFVLIGGCGTALCLLLAILLFSKKASNRKLSELAALPMLFNINEVMIFGLPVIYNPTLLVPFILTPLTSFFISYAAIAAGLVPHITSAVEWTTPVLLGGYHATGSIMGSLLQLVNVAVGVAIYRPFVLAYDEKKEQRAKKHLAELVDIMKRSEESLSDVALTDLASIHGEIARSLAADLDYAMGHDDLTMYYQPQYDDSGRPVGAEALLRWFHPIFGLIYPPLIIELARETGNLERLEKRILQRSVSDAKEVWAEVGRDFEFSVNVSADTLGSPDYKAYLKALASEGSVPVGSVCLEITEQTAFRSGEKTQQLFKDVHELGYRFAIDDFSMGHTSLAYLQENRFDLVKLDGSLVRGMQENPRSREIVASIVRLSKSLDFEVLAEYVETEQMRSDLDDIGCKLYQGYLYSPALKLEDLLTRLEKETVRKV